MHGTGSALGIVILTLVLAAPTAAQDAPFAPQIHTTTYIAPQGRGSLPNPPELWHPQQPAQAVDGAADPLAENRDVRVYRTIGLLDNLMLFGGLDGAKAPEDLGINAGFGTRIGFNWVYPISEQFFLGFQLGVAENFHNNAVRVLRDVDGTTQRFQTWITLGLFQRLPEGLNWGVVYDFRQDDYYTHFATGQWRGQIGYQASPDDEIGFWGTLRMQDDSVRFADHELQIRPIQQAALFWRHVWPSATVTRVWAGLADSHGRFVLPTQGSSPTNTPFLFGAEIFVPLNDWVALWGEANFITPNDTGTVTAFMGIAITPGGTQRYGRSTFAPYLPTANNTSFSLDAR